MSAESFLCKAMVQYYMYESGTPKLVTQSMHRHILHRRSHKLSLPPGHVVAKLCQSMFSAPILQMESSVNQLEKWASRVSQTNSI